jgi:formylglycine-generating enzyme required for sulfatase activity
MHGASHPEGAGCCSPGRGNGVAATATATVAPPNGPPRSTDGMVALSGGVFRMGSDDRLAYPDDRETPREVSVSPFAIDAHAVSNAAFAEFVAGAGYVTEAERFGWSFVFGGLLPDDFPHTRGAAAAPWWRQVYGADWRRPEGPHSDVVDRQEHPAVHVSFNDALAYCHWAGTRLPTEAEWEFAGRGGLEGKAFPWGDDREPDGEHRMNVWQGSFPNGNTVEDGHYGTCPVDAFPPNGYGLHNVTGNVWEWTADWFDETHKVQKGGSYLCHASYCRRYRVAGRQGNEPDASAGNLGFRCAADTTTEGRPFQ